MTSAQLVEARARAHDHAQRIGAKPANYGHLLALELHNRDQHNQLTSDQQKVLKALVKRHCR